MPSRHRFVRLALAALASASLALAAPAGAQSPAEIKIARQTAGEGLTAYNAGEFEKALGLFTQARAVYPSAQIIRMIGYSELALERWDKALDALEAALDAKVAPLEKSDRKEVDENIAKALSHVALITVKTTVTGAKLAVDGKEPRALPLDKPLRLTEGQHKLVVSAPEHLDATNDLKVEGGKPATLTLDPQPKPKPPPLPPPPPPKPERKEWVPQQKLVGIGAIAGGAAFGAAALATMGSWLSWKSAASSHATAHEAAYGKGCAQGDPALCAVDIQLQNRDAATADKLRNVALGLGVTAGVLAATGVVFVVAAPRKANAPADGASPPPATGRLTVSCGVNGGLGVLCAGTF